MQNLDLAPTVLDYAGVSIPRDMQGLSLVPLTTGVEEVTWRSGIFYHYYGTPGGWHHVREHYGIRTDRYKLIHFVGGLNHWELYDLKADPGEQQNLYGQVKYQGVRDDLYDELQALRVHYGDPDLGH